MDKTLHDLGGIVLMGLPTFFLVLVLAFFVKIIYLKPLDKVLEQRFQLTEGARKTAEESLKSADTKIASYQEALNKARADIYREQSEYLSTLHAEQAAQAQSIRADAETRVAAIKLSLAQEADAARDNLEAQSAILAGQIADAILRRKAA